MKSTHVVKTPLDVGHRHQLFLPPVQHHRPLSLEAEAFGSAGETAARVLPCFQQERTGNAGLSGAGVCLLI